MNFEPSPNTYVFDLNRIEAEKTEFDDGWHEIPEFELFRDHGILTTKKSVQDQVIEDMVERKRFGLEKYGKEIMPEDNRDMLQETAEELMDALVYLKAESNVRAELRARIKQLEEENALLIDRSDK